MRISCQTARVAALPDKLFKLLPCAWALSMLTKGAFQWMLACAAMLLLLFRLSEAVPAASETSRNYYDSLGVEPTATRSQIRRAFHKLAVKHHPDKDKSADAERTYREIAEAYTVLSNEQRRRLYDSLNHEAFLENEVLLDTEDEDDGLFTFSDFFHDFDDSFFVEESYFH